MGAFEVSRRTTIQAARDEVRRHIEDFEGWRAWSPWEDVDPDLRRTYSDPSGGVGATYSWEGNRKAGAGSMELTSIEPGEIDVRLRFLKPFKAEHSVAFLLTPAGEGATEVTWRMTGTTKGVMGLVSRVWSMDKVIGPDFEKGLARLKATAEGP